jgi:hypothetical protein
MLKIGSFQAHDRQGISRRAFVQAGMALPLVWSLTNETASAGNQGSAKARSVLLIWLGGGPSHLDLFDPKPSAPAEYRGPFSTIDTRLPGVRFTELLPRLAARSDRFSLVRTNVNFDGDHLVAGSMALTVARVATGNYPPNFGSIVARHRQHLGLPSFVSEARGRIGDGRGSNPDGLRTKRPI